MDQPANAEAQGSEEPPVGGNALAQMAATLTRAPQPRESLVLTYTRKCEYRPTGYAQALLTALRDSGAPMTTPDLARAVGMRGADVSHALRPAVRMGIVRRVGDAWEWAAARAAAWAAESAAAHDASRDAAWVAAMDAAGEEFDGMIYEQFGVAA